MKKQTRQLSGAALCAKEIKQELTAAFPRVKFSVKSDVFSMGDSVDIDWNFGPTVAQVEAITAGRQDGYFDGMQDMYINVKTEKASAKYVHEHRGYATPTEGRYSSAFHVALCEALCKACGVEYTGPDTDIYGGNGGIYWTVGQVAYRAMSETSFTSDNAEFKAVTRATGDSRKDWIIEYVDLKPETAPKTETKKDQSFKSDTPATNAAPVEGLKWVDYSDRSFMVYGDTFPIKDKIKSLGGRFNGFLKHPEDGATVKGWIFPLTAKAQVMPALGL